MSSENRKIDEGTLDALLYLSRLSPESTNLATLRQQVDQIVGYFDILSEFTHNENPYDAWLIKVSDVTKTGVLLDASAYEAVCKSEEA